MLEYIEILFLVNIIRLYPSKQLNINNKIFLYI